MTAQEIRSEVPEHHYFAMIPFMAIDDLNPYEGWLYCHYKRVVLENPNGKCWKSMETLAEETGISVRELYIARDKLVSLGYIRVESRPGMTTLVTLRDLWDINRQRYKYQRELDSGEPLHLVQTTSAPGADEEDISKKEEDEKSTVGQTPPTVAIWGTEKERSESLVKVEGITEGQGEKTYYNENDPDLPDIGRDVLKLLPEHKGKRITKRQVEQLGKTVHNLSGTFASPIDERRDFPNEWAHFIDGIPDTPAWKKRVVEDRTPITPSLIVEFLCNYHWKGGWLEYRPDPNKLKRLDYDPFEVLMNRKVWKRDDRVENQ